MSSCRVPETISKGESCTAPGSSCSILGTTVVPRVSMTPQVSRTVNCSPTRTALLSVLHQHLMGSDGACAASGVTNKTSDRTIHKKFLLIMTPSADSRERSPLLG